MAVKLVFQYNHAIVNYDFIKSKNMEKSLFQIMFFYSCIQVQICRNIWYSTIRLI